MRLMETRKLGTALIIALATLGTGCAKSDPCEISNVGCDSCRTRYWHHRDGHLRLSNRLLR